METPAAVDMKPKRVLTEAQRLAFLKGREKRMANIEKKRLEKEEAKQVEEMPPAPVPSPVKTKTETPPSMPTLKRAEVVVAKTPSIDENKIAETVADKVWARLQAAKPKRKPYTRRESKTDDNETTPAPSAPPTHSFTWM